MPRTRTPHPTPSFLYQLTTYWFCAELVVWQNQVILAAPILRWTLGHPWPEIAAWATLNTAEVTLLTTLEETV